MNTVNALVFGAAALAALTHFASIAIAMRRCGRRQSRSGEGTPPVSLVRPVCGIDEHLETTLRSSFTLGYPDYEILFCVAQPNDPAIPLIESLIADYPAAKAMLLVGDDPVSDNPKLNNCVKGWREVTHEWVVLSDSNVILPPDYLQQLLGHWDGETGLVCAPPAGCDPRSVAAELECAFLNEYQARWQYFADTLGAGFAQGKNMLWRRDILDARGGIAVLGNETAEDATATKLVREAGLSVRLAGPPFAQPLGVRAMREVWSRQVRWARLRRASFPLCFALEIVSGGVLPTLAVGYCAAVLNLPVLLAAVFAAAWYGAEWLLATRAGWHRSWRSPLCCLARDLLLPVVWIEGWRARSFEWRGNAMVAAPGGAG